MTNVRPVAPEAVRWIVRKLEAAGFETWAVGGAIRDAIRRKPSGDWDLATRARPGQMRRTFRRTVPIGVDHGTVGILAHDGTMYEVTTFRKDVETDGRHAVVEFADSIADDLSRRDFTINAIAWHPLREEFFDPFDGTSDIEAGVVRTVGAATERFREDYLRILRALRFAGRFEMRIEAETWTAMSALAGYLTGLSPERVREELLKVLDADPTPSRSLRLYADSGVLAVLYPELAARDADAFSKTLASLDRLPTGRPYLRLAALLRMLDPAEAVAVLMRLRLSNAAVDRAAHLAAAPRLPPSDATDAELRRWLSRVGPDRVSAVSRMDLAAARASADAGSSPDEVVAAWRALRRVRRVGAPLTVSELAIDGRTLIRLGMRPGPHFGEILDALLEWVLEDPERNEREMLEAQAQVVSAGLTGAVAGGESDG